MSINVHLPSRLGQRGGRSQFLALAGSRHDGAEAIEEVANAEAGKVEGAAAAFLPEKACRALGCESGPMDGRCSESIITLICCVFDDEGRRDDATIVATDYEVY